MNRYLLISIAWLWIMQLAPTRVLANNPSGNTTDTFVNTYSGFTHAPAKGFSFTSPKDENPPVVLIYSPAENASGVLPGTDLILTFNENIKKGSGTIVIQNGAIAQNIVVDDPQSQAISIVGNVVTINPPEDFSSSAVVTVQIPAGAFLDETDVPAGAITWTFTIVDFVSPQATFVPAPGSVGVARNTSLEMNFDEPIQKGSGDITVYQNGRPSSIAVDNPGVVVSGTKVTIPPFNFDPGASVYVVMPAGIFKDLTGNNYGGISDAGTWSFTAVDNVAPTITDYSPATNSAGILPNANLVLTFSENVIKGTGNIIIQQGSSTQQIDITSALVTITDNKVTIDAADFPSGAQVYVTMPSGVFKDAAGNLFAGINSTTEWRFTVADVNAPTATLLPEKDEVNVARSTSLVMTFSEAVKKGTGNISIYQNGALVQVIPVSDPAVAITGTGTTVRITPMAFAPGANIYIQMPAGVFLDLENNPYAGITDATTWRFSVIDDVPPTPIANGFSPVNGATNVAADANLVILFSENIQKGTGAITITINGIAQTIDVASAGVSTSGNRVTINPPADFPSSASVNVQIPAGIFTDLAGNAYAGITDASAWNFTVVDNVAPTYTDLSPAPNAVGIAASANLVITFSENVRKGSGNITINQSGASPQVINVSDAAVSIINNSVTINPPADFPSSATVSVQIPAGVFTDLAGNSFAGINNTTTWSFKVADINAPSVTAFSPADNATNVAANADLVITFSENVKKGSGNITINQSGTSPQVINVSDAAVSIINNIVTINPPVDFPTGAAVNVQMPAGVFLDLENNPHAGITDATTWNFTIADNVAPTVTALSPADDASNVAVDVNLVITFSENVKKGSGNITINQSGASPQVINVSSAIVSISNNVVTINPSANFPSGANVNVQMPAGVFTDIAGNAYAGINSATAWNFSVADIVAPTVVQLSPADNATKVAPNTDLVMTFSENVQKGTGNITINHGSTSQVINVTDAAVSISGKTVTINPPTDFPAGVGVSVLMPAGVITDIAGNAYAGIIDATTWNFTTVDNVPPVVSALYPANGATEVPPNANLIMTFNEPVQKGSGVITINQGATSQTINVGNAEVSIANNVVIINPSVDFTVGANVNVQMPAGTLIDMAANPYAGISNATTWAFSVSGTLDETPPTVVELVPADNSLNAPANGNLVMTFSENVQKGSGIITINQGGTIQQINVISDAVTIDGKVVTINPPTDLLEGANVNVQMPAGTFKDFANNPYSGITNATTWNFTVSIITFLAHNYPEVIQSSEASVPASVEVYKLPAGVTVEFVAKGIAQPQTAWTRTPITSTGNVFSADLLLSQFDEVGLTYYFEFTLANGTKVPSNTGYTAINYTGVGLTHSNLKTGGEITDYQIISVPLTLVNKNASAVFENDFGAYDDTKWRLFGYADQALQEYTKGLATVEPGKGYWLISRSQSTLTTGEGSTVKVSQAAPFSIPLQKGWNLIGNPYQRDVNWADVKSFHQNPAWLGELRVYEGGFSNGTVLKKFSGGFVFVEKDTVVQIPLGQVGQSNGRIAATSRHHESSTWEVNFTLKSKSLSHRLGGVGMNPGANPGKDVFDDIAVPRFLQYLDVRFSHPEYFAPNFAKDIVPVEENYQWEFTVESNLTPQWVHMEWERYFSQVSADKQIWLYDLQQDQAIDLKAKSEHRFWLDKSSRFRLYYGSSTYIQEELSLLHSHLGKPYPNPLITQTTIPFYLSEWADQYHVQLSIYNLSGLRVAVLTDQEYAAGRYEVIWNGTDAGRRLPAGMYICRMELVAGNVKQVFYQKIFLP